jgi:hypothetical protein
MLNYNLNLIGTARQNRNIEGFAAFPRLDPYSASLALAIPGTVFLQDYDPLFGATNPYDDISGYIKFGTTNQNLPTQLTGSGVMQPNVNTNNFTAQGYPSSLYVSGSIAALFSSSVAYQGLNLSTGALQNNPNDVGCLIECWVAFPVTGSVSGSLGAPTTNPYRLAAAKPKLLRAPILSDVFNYAFDPGFSGDRDDTAPIQYVSGSIRFIQEGINNTEKQFLPSPSGSRTITQYQFKHYAISISAPWDNGVASNNTRARMYINGELMTDEQVTSQFSSSIEPVHLFGYVGTDGAGNPWGGTEAFFQDLRIYNGTNKNYTGSMIPLPESMVVARPY